MKVLEKALRAELRGWGPPLSTSALAQAALEIAKRLGAEDLGDSAAAQLFKEFRGYHADLRKLAPVGTAADDVDDIRQQREKRRLAAGQA